MTKKTVTQSKERSLVPQRDDFDYFNWIRDNGNLTFVSPAVWEVTSKTGRDGEDPVTFKLRHLAAFFPFTLPQWNHIITWDGPLAGALLAVHHLNNGISDIVPDIKILSSDDSPCKDTKFTIEFLDTASSIYLASRTLTNDVLSRRRDRHKNKKPFPTALIGAVQSRITSPLATLSGVNSLVQVSHVSTSSVLDNKDEYPLFGRTVASVSANAHAAVSYLSDVLNVTHVGVLYIRDEWGTQYFRAFQEMANLLDPPMVVVASSYNPVEKPILNSLDVLVESEFRYFFGIIYTSDATTLMPEAYIRGIAGEKNMWLFAEGLFSEGADINQLPQFYLKAVYGSAVITSAPKSALFCQKDEYDSFISSWQELIETNDFLRYIESNRPVTNNVPAAPRIGNDPYPYLIYDAIVSVALATCEAEIKRGDLFVTAEQIFQSLMDNEFDGASGRVKFDKTTGSRDPSTFPFAVYNMITSTSPTNRNTSPKTTLILRLTHLQHQTTQCTSSRMIGWTTTDSQFIYNDGSNVPPPILPLQETNINPIDRTAIVICLTMCALVLFLSIYFGFWTFFHRKTPVVKKSQPVFLGMLCVGTFLLGLSIVPLSFQEPLSQEVLDTGCMISPLLGSIGFVTAVSALICKTDRLNKTSRRTMRDNHEIVTEMDVLMPFALRILFIIGIFACWAIVAPMKYTYLHNFSSLDRFGRPTDAQGMCLAEEGKRAQFRIFMTLLWFMYATSLLHALAQAYWARSISTEYSESQYMMLSIVLTFETWIIAVPVLLSLKNATPRFVVFSGHLSVICFAFLLPIFVPKVRFLRKWREEKERMEEVRRLGMEHLRELEEHLDANEGMEGSLDIDESTR